MQKTFTIKEIRAQLEKEYNCNDIHRLILDKLEEFENRIYEIEGVLDSLKYD